MKLETVEISTTGQQEVHYEARQRYLEYRKAVREGSDPASREDDVVLQRAYLEISRGRRVFHLGQAMSEAGLRPDWLPKLAIARADAEQASVWMDSHGSAWFYSVRRPEWGGSKRQTSRIRHVHENTFQRGGAYGRSAWCVVPSIPPAFWPQHALHNYHLMWEAHWNAVPVDPLLLRHLGGNVFAIMAHWDLSPIERAVLRGRL